MHNTVVRNVKTVTALPIKAELLLDRNVLCRRMYTDIRMHACMHENFMRSNFQEGADCTLQQRSKTQAIPFSVGLHILGAPIA